MRFTVLGSVGVEHDGSPVAVGGRQQRRLLGALIVARGGPVSAERLIDAVWSDGEVPDGAARSVMTYVSRLRGVVGGDRIQTDGPGYRFVGNGAGVDVDEFDRLLAEAERALPDRAVECYDEALALWHGPAYGEFASEWWAVAESTRLEERRLVARTERAAALISLGHAERAVPDLEGLLVDHPLRERAISLLMQALDAGGRKAEALRVFRTYRSRLTDETGLDPSDELCSLERTLVGGDAPREIAPGRPLRGYVLHDAIGEGSFGRVYGATQPGTERRVAIKMIHPALADSADFIRRFEAEARLVARLEHPNIVPLYDYWREPGGAYLVFRYLGGGTARDTVISGGAWSLARVSQLVEQVGGALIAAHAAGIVHNDVKANNVLLDDTGNAYLTDFGIAVSANDADTPLGQRTDVRAFGWMLWELLTGVRPHAGSASSAAPASASATPSLIGHLAAVPEGLDAVLARATTPGDSAYGSVAELVVAWRAAVGRPEGVLSPIGSDDRRILDSARRAAAHQLAKDAVAGVNPYKGLRAFDEADAAEFFGRDAIADDLAEWVASHRLTTVVGPSGSGKSSLVRAGLVPRLGEAGHTIVSMVPGDDPVAALRTALSEVASRRGRTKDLVTLVGHVATECGRLVLLVDQFEECWTRSDDGGRDGFIDTLARLVEGTVDVHIVTTIRADVFDRPLEEPRLGSHVAAGAYAIASMSPADLAEAITRPAARAGVIVDDAVVADLVAESVTQLGPLPLLQFTLAELYDRRVDGRIGPDTLIAVGGMAGSIGRRAEEVHDALDEPGRSAVGALFDRLVTPGDGAPDTRRRARLSELSPDVRAVADRFVEARLLVTDRDPATREPTLEIAHEALLTRWSRLAGWIDEDRRWLTQLQHLSMATRAWEERGRNAADLYRGSRLEAAIEAIELDGRELSELERGFVHAGQQERDREVRTARRTARRLRRFLVATAVLLVLSIVAGALAYVAQRRARDEEWDASHRALVSNATALRANKRDVAALLAAEAHRLAPSAATESALFGVFTDAPGLDRTVYPEFWHDGDALMIDDETIAIQEATGTVHLVDIGTGAERARLTFLDDDEGFTVWMSATPDARYLATAWRNHGLPDRGVLTVWDLMTNEQRFANVDIGYAMGTVSISPDGSRVAIGGGRDARVDIYDAATGERLVEVDPIPRPDDAHYVVNTVALVFTNPGQLIATSQTGVIRFIDPANGTELRRIVGPPETAEGQVRLSPDGTSLVTAGFVGLMRYDLVSGEPLWREPAQYGECIEMAYVARRDVVVCGEGSGRLREVDLATGAIDDVDIGQRAGGLCEILVTPDGDTVVITSCTNRQITTWRVDGNGAISRLLAPQGENQFVWDYAADGTSLYAEEEVRPEEWETQRIDVASGDIDTLSGIFWPLQTSDPAHLAVEFDDGTHGIYDVASGEPLNSFDPAFGIDGAVQVGERWLMWGWEDNDGDNEWHSHLALIDPSGDMFYDLVDLQTQGAAALDDGNVVTVECGRPVFVCVLQRRDASTGAAIGEVAGDDGTGYTNVVARAGTLVAVANDGQVRVLDPQTLDPIGGPLPGLSGAAAELVLSADGRRLLVLAQDATVRFYDVPSRTQLGDAIAVGESPRGVALRADGLEAAFTTDQGIVAWSLDPAQWVDGVCAVAGRNLTRAEWDQYLGDLAPYHETCPDLGPAA